jgi:competence protein ComEA
MQEKKYFKEFFTYSKQEIRGIIVLAILILTLITIRLMLKSTLESFVMVYKKGSTCDDTSAIFRTGFKEHQSRSDEKEKNSILPWKGKFDPNTITYKEMVSRGFSKRIASNIIKYREKGGIFHQPEDLFKIYGMDSVIFYIQYPDISINSRNNQNKKPTDLIQAKTKHIIEINSADSVQLIDLDGIGKVLSKRIIKYRELVGGFYDIHQLKEVYGITDSLYSKISPRLKADTSLVKKININNCTFYDLKKHPYIGDYDAKSIINYRKLMGPIDSLQQLLENQILTNEHYEKIVPYLTLN